MVWREGVVRACGELGAFVYRGVCLAADSVGNDALGLVRFWFRIAWWDARFAREIVVSVLFVLADDLVVVEAPDSSDEDLILVVVVRMNPVTEDPVVR